MDKIQRLSLIEFLEEFGGFREVVVQDLPRSLEEPLGYLFVCKFRQLFMADINPLTVRDDCVRV